MLPPFESLIKAVDEFPICVKDYLILWKQCYQSRTDTVEIDTSRRNDWLLVRESLNELQKLNLVEWRMKGDIAVVKFPMPVPILPPSYTADIDQEKQC